MGVRATLSPAAVDTRQTSHSSTATHSRRHLLCPARRLRLALSPQQLPSLADGVLPFQAVPPQRRLAPAVYGPASRRARARRLAERRQRGHVRQPTWKYLEHEQVEQLGGPIEAE